MCCWQDATATTTTTTTAAAALCTLPLAQGFRRHFHHPPAPTAATAAACVAAAPPCPLLDSRVMCHATLVLLLLCPGTSRVTAQLWRLHRGSGQVQAGATGELAAQAAPWGGVRHQQHPAGCLLL
jgi:hypothetical protein